MLQEWHQTMGELLLASSAAAGDISMEQEISIAVDKIKLKNLFMLYSFREKFVMNAEIKDFICTD